MNKDSKDRIEISQEGSGEEKTETCEEDRREKRGLSLYQRVHTMSVPEKIQLAFKGNKEARTLLIRGANRAIFTAVMRSPSISENEILQIAQSPDVDEEVLRIIARNKEWMNRYETRAGLVNNPKPPLDLSLKTLSTLRRKDLALLSKSKNVPIALSNRAQKLLDAKSTR